MLCRTLGPSAVLPAARPSPAAAWTCPAVAWLPCAEREAVPSRLTVAALESRAPARLHACRARLSRPAPERTATPNKDKNMYKLYQSLFEASFLSPCSSCRVVVSTLGRHLASSTPTRSAPPPKRAAVAALQSKL